LRTRDERDLHPVLEHNERDVRSLVTLLERLAALVAGRGRATAIDALALGRLYVRRGEAARAEVALGRAVAQLPQSFARDEALWRLARLYKRSGRRADAEPLWLELAERRRSLRAHEELAVYYEHQRRDVARAAAATERALHIATGLSGSHARLAALQRRHARLQRKRSAEAARS
jgi:tetratricopeptide (TPR) repeat protein